jgi:Flp pilus assembly protein TadG
VELALGMPVLLMLTLGGTLLGRSLMTRHRLADATSFATRAAAIARQTNPGQIRQAVLQQMGTEAQRCQSLTVQAQVVPGVTPGGTLQVTSVCQLAPLFRGDAFGAVGPTTLTVQAAMPL